MKLFSRTACGLLAAVALVACGQSTAPATTETAEIAASPIDNCASWPSRDWSANVDTGMTGRVLHVRGKIDFPSLGYTWTIAPNVADDPASGAVRLTLTPVAPQAGGAAIDTNVALTYDAPATAPRYTEIVVLCGRRTLATITDIPETT
jgi:hypothetical protein